MKAILEFDISTREGQIAHLRCIKASSMAIALFEIQRNLRKSLANYADHLHENNQENAGVFMEGVDKVIEEINDIVYNEGIIIDDLLD